MMSMRPASIGRVLEPAAQVANVIAQAASGGQVGQVQAVDRLGGDQAVFHQVLHGVGQWLVMDQVITVEAVFVELVQVHIVQAGAAVQHAIVNHKALKMQHAKQLAGLYRHPIHRHLRRV